MTLSFSAKIAPNKTIINNTTEIFLAIGSNFIATFDANFLKTIPIITGTVTIKNMLIAILVKEIFISTAEFLIKINDIKTIAGTVITLNKLIIAVSDIERATSPFAKEVNKLDVTPPGAAAIIITPIASSGDIDHILNHTITRINAIIGSKIICEKAPTKKSRGCFATLKKSAPVKPKPSTNIIKARAKGKITSVTIFICVSIKTL